MVKWSLLLLGVLVPVAVWLAVAIAKSPVRQEDLKSGLALTELLKPLHRELGKPQPGDWLLSHNEPGQTYRQYLQSRPVKPTKSRNILYVQPIGGFTEKQQAILSQTTEFLGLYFGVETKTRQLVPLSSIPDKAQRRHPTWGDHQVLTGYVLNSLLAPELPDDALAMIAFTSFDLWPGKGWNFVFGQASLRNRVGVWSIYRNGDPDAGKEAYLTCLLRTMKTASHETGHMISMQHCIYYECNMCGSNNRAESDRRPVYLCPICAAKLTWSTSTDPRDRARKLGEFCERVGLNDEAEYYAKCMEVLQ